MVADTVKEISATPSGASDGLIYSRHYAERIRDFGQTSKSSWIERLNVVLSYCSPEEFKEDMGNGHSDKSDHHSYHKQNQGASLPALNQKSVYLTNTSKATPRFYGYASRDHNRPLPESLQNSPYNVPMVRDHGTPRSYSADSPAGAKNASKKIEKPPPKYSYTSHNDGSNNSNNINQQVQKLPSIQSNGSVGKFIGRKSPNYKQTVTKSLTGNGSNKPTIIITSRTERKAREFADSALRASKVFICEGPYPIDRFVRLGLRKRGWVEKFREGGSFPAFYKDSAAPLYTSSHFDRSSHQTSDQEIEAILSESLPHPMVEDAGIYCVMARLVRHFPAKFIWAGTGLNNLPFRSDTIVNHFPKAKCFSSKTGLCVSLRELPWLASNTSMHFFPRCYVLNDNDKEDFIDDYRLTACLGILKWILKKYTVAGEASLPIHRENSQVEIIKEGEYIIKRHKTATCTDHHKQDMDSSSAREKTAPEQLENMNIVPEKTDMTCDSGKSKKVHCPGTPKELSDLEDRATELHRLNSTSDMDIGGVCEEESMTRDLTFEKATEIDSENIQDQSDLPSRKKKSRHRETDSNDKNDVPRKIVPCLKKKSSKKGEEVPITLIDLVLTQLERFFWVKEHKDVYEKVKKKHLYGAEWNKVLQWHYQLMHENAVMPVTESKLNECAAVLKQMEEYWPQMEMDGMKNIWIIKPGLKSKGIGITCCCKLEDILQYIDNSSTGSCYVVQKYIENPLLLHNCKFDIRQWFLVTEWNPLTVWFYKDCYLRICSQEFSLDDFHESIHLSNVAIQQFYENGPRSDKLPENNFMTSRTFQEYLKEKGDSAAWDTIIFPGMKDAVINMLLATQDVAESRKCGFELYGADFMLTSDYAPWLIEVNASPGMSPSSKEKVTLCSNVIEDTLKVVLDRKENKQCDTGGFELAFKQNPIPQQKFYDTNMKIEGRKIKKIDLEKYYQLDKKNASAAAKKDKQEAAARRAAELDAAVAKMKLMKAQTDTATQKDHSI